MKIHPSLLVLLMSLQGHLCLGMDLQDVKREIEKNSESIKSLQADVDVTLALPMSTLSDRFHLIFKYPNRIRVTSIKTPEKFYVHRPDTTYLSPAAGKDASAMMMGAFMPDKKGLMFNYMSGIGTDKTGRLSPCGKNICITIENDLAPELHKMDTSATAKGKASISFVYSPDEKVILEMDTMAGSSLSKTLVEYQTESGVKVPKTLVIQNGPTTFRMEFKNWKLNGKVADNVFK